MSGPLKALTRAGKARPSLGGGRDTNTNKDDLWANQPPADGAVRALPLCVGTNRGATKAWRRWCRPIVKASVARPADGWRGPRETGGRVHAIGIVRLRAAARSLPAESARPSAAAMAARPPDHSSTVDDACRLQRGRRSRFPASTQPRSRSVECMRPAADEKQTSGGARNPGFLVPREDAPDVQLVDAWKEARRSVPDRAVVTEPARPRVVFVVGCLRDFAGRVCPGCAWVRVGWSAVYLDVVCVCSGAGVAEANQPLLLAWNSAPSVCANTVS